MLHGHILLMIALGIGGDGGEGRRFPGSPPAFVDRMDIGPGRQDDPPFFGCRTYPVDGKTVGVPPET